jgi:hypothetical protein
MTAHLERRRQAIAEALRAIMAEPFPDRTAPTPPVAALSRATSPPNGTVAPAATVPPPATLDPVAPVASAAPAIPPAARVADDRAAPPLREALAAHIDWDHVEELEDLDEDWESPAIPPLEPVGGMSRTASMALFGHA